MIHAGHRPLGQNKFQEAWRSDNDDILATLIYVHTLSLSIESQVRIDKHHQKEVPGRVDAATPTQNTDTAPYDVVR